MFLIEPTPHASVYVSVQGQMLGCSSLLNGGGLKSAETRFSRRLHVPQMGWVSKTFGKSQSPSRLQLCRFLKANWIFPLVSAKVFYKGKTCLTTSLYTRLYMILVPFFSKFNVCSDCRLLGTHSWAWQSCRSGEFSPKLTQTGKNWRSLQHTCQLLESWSRDTWDRMWFRPQWSQSDHCEGKALAFLGGPGACSPGKFWKSRLSNTHILMFWSMILHIYCKKK